MKFMEIKAGVNTPIGINQFNAFINVEKISYFGPSNAVVGLQTEIIVDGKTVLTNMTLQQVSREIALYCH